MRAITQLWIIFWTVVLAALLVLHVIDRIWPTTYIGGLLKQFESAPEEPQRRGGVATISVSSVRLTEMNGGLHVEMTISNESERRLVAPAIFIADANSYMLMNLVADDGARWRLCLPEIGKAYDAYLYDPLDIVMAPGEAVSIWLFHRHVFICENQKRHLPQNPPPTFAYSVSTHITEEVKDEETGEAVVVKVSGAGICTFKRE